MRSPKVEAPTIRDVAQRAGVSVATVSRYLNGSVHILRDTALRVARAMDVLGYLPRTAARSLALQRSMTIGLVSEGIGGEYFVPLLEGIEDEANAAGFGVLVSSTRRWPAEGPGPLGPQNCDGVIALPHRAFPSRLEAWSRSGFPLVFAHCLPPEGMDCPSVGVENRRSAGLVTLHLARVHGRRRIAFLAGTPGHSDAAERLEGYRGALAEAGIPYDASLVLAGDFDGPTAEASLGRALDAGLRLDAVFAGDDASALGALKALRSRGLAVPGEVSLFGFDGRAEGRCFPPLSSVRTPAAEVGRAAARALAAAIRGESVPRRTVLPTVPAYGGSCGCPLCGANSVTHDA